uniref:Putative salivary secreted protein n=1 Tax=Ixodes ricinus TaxID=34613 RepID=A0A6B0UVX8_IXORI
MQGQAKIIICGTLMIVHGILNGVLSQWPPSSSPCYNDVLAVGDIFCTITGQHGFMTFLWPPFPKILVVLCNDVYLNLSIPFNVTGDDIVKKSPELWQTGKMFHHHDNAPAHTALGVPQVLSKNFMKLYSTLPIPPTSPRVAFDTNCVFSPNFQGVS